MRRITLSFFFLLLTACASAADEEPLRPPTLAGSLQPYQSPVPSPTPLPATPAPTETPFPTPTPRLYQISSGETMGEIALKFGITTQALMAANPDVQPSAMSVGQKLIIPDRETTQDLLPTPGAIDLEIHPPDCYPTLSGGIWCFALVENGEANPVEGISAQMTLSDLDGRGLASEAAFSLLDRIPAGESLPLLAYYPDIPVEEVKAELVLLTAFEAQAGDSRYLPALLRNVLTEISWDGRAAEVSGQVLVEGAATQIWILATAVDAKGDIVGVRRWETETGEQNFHLMIASLGPVVEQIDLLVEAKP